MSEVRNARTVSEPFPGPRPFARGESEIFKGRERESRDLRDLVLAYQVVVFHSDSGSGKTSLVNAGLLPLLTDEGIDSHLRVRVGGQVPPGIDASQIGNIYTFDAVSSCFGPSLDPNTALQTDLAQALMAKPDSAPRLLILDQFEELFTSHPERWEDRKPFVEQVSKLCEVNKDLRVLIVIRDDHLAELDRYAEILPYSLRIRYRLERLREDSALKGIVEPLLMAGYMFEQGIAEDLVGNLRKTQVQTPAGVLEIVGEFVEPVHLQLVCQNLWRHRPTRERPFSADDVKRFADVDQTLRAFYEDAIGLAVKKTGIDEGRLRSWFEVYLIKPGGTRGLAFQDQNMTEGIPNSVIAILESQRLIGPELRSGFRWYELTHDRFIRPIQGSNQEWKAEHGRGDYEAEYTEAVLKAEAETGASQDVRLQLPMLLPKNERAHLVNLALGRTATATYKGNYFLRGELRRLRSLGLIKMRPDQQVGYMKDGLAFDLAHYVELTDLGKRWTRTIQEIEKSEARRPVL